MLMSMNVFQQISRPKLLCTPSSSCHRSRRIPPHNPPLLVSFPATKMGFNPNLLHLAHGIQHYSCKPVLASPPTMELDPKFMYLMYGIQHSSSKHVLSSPATMKSSSVLFALPKDSGELSSDNEDEPIIQEHDSSISSDSVHEKKPKKAEFVVREATLNVEFWASACLKMEGFFEEQSPKRNLNTFEKKQHAKQVFNLISSRYKERHRQPYMCIIAVRKEGENEFNEMLKNVIGTLDFRVLYLLRGETFPEEFVTAKMIKSFRQREARKYGMISNVFVTENARRQGVARSMLKFVIESAKQNGVKQLFLYVRRDNKTALELYMSLGFTIVAKATATPLLEERKQYLCSLNL